MLAVVTAAGGDRFRNVRLLFDYGSIAIGPPESRKHVRLEIGRGRSTRAVVFDVKVVERNETVRIRREP